MFKAMFSGRMEVVQDTEGTRPLLTGMRNGNWAQKHSGHERRRINVVLERAPYLSHSNTVSLLIQVGCWSIAMVNISISFLTISVTVPSLYPIVLKRWTSSYTKRNSIVSSHLSNWPNSNYAHVQERVPVILMRVARWSCWHQRKNYRILWPPFANPSLNSPSIDTTTNIPTPRKSIYTEENTSDDRFLSSSSDEMLMKNIELFDKLSIRLHNRILFVKDVTGSEEICCWSFYGNGQKMAEVCCTSIVYATERKHNKVRSCSSSARLNRLLL